MDSSFPCQSVAIHSQQTQLSNVFCPVCPSSVTHDRGSIRTRPLTNWLLGYLPDDVLRAVMRDLARLAEEASSEEVMNWTSNAEKQQPYAKTHNAWGARYDVDKFVTSEGWKNLRRWGAQNGYVCSYR